MGRVPILMGRVTIRRAAIPQDATLQELNFVLGQPAARTGIRENVQAMALKDIRRVITVHDQSGAAVLQSDSITPHKYAVPGGGPVAHGIWLTESVPAAAIGVADRYAGHRGIAPPNGGTVFTVVDFPPSEPRAATNAAEMQNRIDPAHGS